MEKTTLPAGVFFCTQDQARQRYADRKTQLHREAMDRWKAEGGQGSAPQVPPGDLRIDVGTLDRARRGDWVRLMIDFPTETGHAFELVTAMVKDAEHNLVIHGLLRVRILTHLESSNKHSIVYGDDIVIHNSWVLEHSRSTDETVRTTAHFLEDMKLVVPQPGKKYWTRDGSEANIWTAMHDQNGEYLIGEVRGSGNIEWLPTGAHRGGVSSLDIVKDPTASEIIREGA